MPGRKFDLFLLLIAWIPVLVQAQQTPISLQDVEDLLYRNESALIPESLTGEFPESLSLTIDLNNASSEELEASGIFTPYQIHTLQTYLEKFGPIYSIYEIATLPGFHPSLVMEVEPYVCLNPKKNTTGRNHGRYMVLFNLERSFPTAEGFMENPDSGDEALYTGPPLKTILRIRAHPWKKLSMALSYEKDAGELFLYRNRPQFLSGYLSYEGERFVKQLVVGNYKLNQGVGLVNGAGFMHRAGDFRINQLSLSRIKPYASLTETRYEQGLAEYAKTILTAFSEVESALLTRKEQLERRDRIMNFLMEARATQKVAESRYERGLVDYLTVLDAQQTRFEAEEKLVLVDLAILSNRVTLHRALGGGWGDPTQPRCEKKL